MLPLKTNGFTKFILPYQLVVGRTYLVSLLRLFNDH